MTRLVPVRRHQEGGQVIPLVAIAVLVVAAMLAGLARVGADAVARAQAQTAADAAALAGAAAGEDAAASLARLNGGTVRDYRSEDGTVTVAVVVRGRPASARASRVGGPCRSGFGTARLGQTTDQCSPSPIPARR